MWTCRRHTSPAGALTGARGVGQARTAPKLDPCAGNIRSRQFAGQEPYAQPSPRNRSARPVSDSWIGIWIVRVVSVAPGVGASRGPNDSSSVHTSTCSDSRATSRRRDTASRPPRDGTERGTGEARGYGGRNYRRAGQGPTPGQRPHVRRTAAARQSSRSSRVTPSSAIATYALLKRWR